MALIRNNEIHEWPTLYFLRTINCALAVKDRRRKRYVESAYQDLRCLQLARGYR